MTTLALAETNQSAAAKADVPIWRLYLLRATYLLIVVGLGSEVWPALTSHPLSWPLWHGVGVSLLCGVTVLAALGLRYPLKMLPLLFFEIAWKTTWLIAIAWPLTQNHQVDAGTADTINACLKSVIFPLIIPWGYVWKTYVRAPGDRWLPMRKPTE